MKKLCKKITVLLVIFIFLLMYKNEAYAQQDSDYNKPDDIIVVLDVSGSMKITDTDRLSFETIEVLTKLCADEDRIGIVAFNEGIVYQCDLTNISDKKRITNILNDLHNVKYQGDTDSGQALVTGVNLFENENFTDRNQALIFITDGKIDIPNPVEGRTEKDSQKDMESAVSMAKERGISIFTFGFADSEPELADELTIIAKATGANSYICSGPLQMMNNIFDVTMIFKENESKKQITGKCDENMHTTEVAVDKNSSNCIILQASEEIVAFEAIPLSGDCKIDATKHCRIINFDDCPNDKITLCYETQKAGNVIINHIKADAEKQIREEVSIEIPEIDIKDFISPNHTTTYQDYPLKKESNIELVIALIVITIVTLIICVLIVCAFFKKGKKRKIKTTALKGYLDTCFIDLKSKNDIPAMVWDLSAYPPEGVTLEELFAGSKVHEDLPQLEKICLYPDDSGEGLILVHCADGGIFVDDKNVSQNVPVHVHYGETIYVAFPENASEFSLKYLEKKEDR